MGINNKLNVTSIAILVLFAFHANAQVFDITQHGAHSNGDATNALLESWKLACESPSHSKVVIPSGTYKISQAIMDGPCKAPIEFNLQGTLQAGGLGSVKLSENWIMFQHVDHLTVTGNGVFDGQGSSAWGKHCDHRQFCGALPINVRFNFLTNSVIQGVTSLNSKQFHTNVLGCNNVTFRNYKVRAPEDSVNTDGIHIGRSNDIKILDSDIQTGDDCISIGDGSTKITVTNVNCGPGHGISIGSLGKYTNEQPVEGIYITHCRLSNTLNGVRIKTWPDSHQGVASDMHFEDIIMDNVGNPVLIDQEYCPWNQCNLKASSRVKLSDVSFKKIRGTSSTPLAVNLVCSSGAPCVGVVLQDIDLKYNGPDGPITSRCKHIRPSVSGVQHPPPCMTYIAGDDE